MICTYEHNYRHTNDLHEFLMGFYKPVDFLKGLTPSGFWGSRIFLLTEQGEVIYYPLNFNTNLISRFVNSGAYDWYEIVEVVLESKETYSCISHLNQYTFRLVIPENKSLVQVGYDKNRKGLEGLYTEWFLSSQAGLVCSPNEESLASLNSILRLCQGTDIVSQELNLPWWDCLVYMSELRRHCYELELANWGYNI